MVISVARRSPTTALLTLRSLQSIQQHVTFRQHLVQEHLCSLSTIERAWSRDHATSSVTDVLPPPGHRSETVCLNSFGNRTSPLDNLNDR